MGKVVLKHTGSLSNIGSVINHAKYVGFRSTELKEKGFFDKNNDKIKYKDFIKRVKSNKALKHSKSIKVQKLVFSLREYDYDAYKNSGKDYKNLIKNTLAEYEKRHNIKLDWIANTHEKEGHPHCHVIIKGVSDNKDNNDKFTRIYFDKEKYKEIKDIFNQNFYSDVKYDKRDLDRLDDKSTEKILYDVSKGFEQIIKHIQHDIEKEQVKAEQQRDIIEKKSQRQNEKKSHDR